MDLGKAIEEYDSNDLIHYLDAEIVQKGNLEVLFHHYETEPCHPLNIYFDDFPCTSLQKALHEGKSEKVILKLIEIGGSRLVKMRSEIGETVLHFACITEYSHPVHVISRLIDEGGGREMVMMKCSETGETALHKACNNNEYASIDIITKLIEVGGREFLMEQDNDEKSTALHFACWGTNTPMEIISKLIEAGGRELVMKEDGAGHIALYRAYNFDKEYVLIDIAKKLIEVGGRDMLTHEDDYGRTALHHGYFLSGYQQSTLLYDDAFAFLVKESILADVGQEFGIGGLFNVADEDVQKIIHDRWENLSPALISAFESLDEQQRPPILHAAIHARAPPHVFDGIISDFEYSVLKTDSSGLYPIVVAIWNTLGWDEGCLGWNEGLQKVVEATAVAQQQTKSIYTAAQYGLQWTNHMKELAEENADEVINGRDDLTGLPLFIIAAMGKYYDLSSIYGIVRMSPETIIGCWMGVI